MQINSEQQYSKQQDLIQLCYQKYQPFQSEDNFHTFKVNNTDFRLEKKYKFVEFKDFSTCIAVDQENGQKVEIKQLAINKIFDTEGRDLFKSIARGIKIQNHFQHENIRSNLYITMDTENFYIVKEFVWANMDRIIRSNQELSDDHIQYFSFQILRALFYLHSQNICLPEITPKSILVTQTCDLKLDFFYFRCIPSTDDCYISPEAYFDISLKNYLKNDIWKLGLIIVELMSKKIFTNNEIFFDILGTPLEEDLLFLKDNIHAYQQVKSQFGKKKQCWQTLFPTANPLLCDLLNKMIVFNPEKRYSAEDCLKHPYFLDLHEKNSIQFAKEFDHSQLQIGDTEDQILQEIYSEAGKYYLKKIKIFEVYIIQNISFKKHQAPYIPLNPNLLFYNLYEDL
ncbi:hypothetical protein ABPG74_013190 [Tetrahymena malaccensis]